MSKSEDKKKELLYKDKFLLNIIEQSPFPTFIIDSKGICVMTNNAFMSRWGIKDKDFAYGFDALNDPDNIKHGIDKYLRQALGGKVVETPEIYFVSPASKKLVVTRSSIFPIFDTDNNVVNVAVMQIDLTEQKKAEKEKTLFSRDLKFLSESVINLFKINDEDKLYKYLLDHLLKLIEAELIIVSVYDKKLDKLVPKYIDGNNIFVKESWTIYKKFTNTKSNNELNPEILQSNLFEVKGGLYELSFGSIPKEACKEIEKVFDYGKLYTIGLNKEKHLYGCISVILRKGKEINNIEILETFIKQVSIVLYYKQVEKDLIVAKEKAEASDNLKTAFIANISHEIRTPLHAINGFSKILNTKEVGKEKEQQYLQYIIANCNTLQNLLEDLINISQIESGQVHIHNQNFSIDDVFNNIYLNFLETINISNKDNLKLIYDKQPSTKNLSISSDPFRIRQILNNLISNAIKFTNNGFIKFGCKIVDDNKLLFFVKDTGIGISKEKRQIIFERFQWANNNEQNSGTGLGLSISKNLTELLGGEIWLESEEKTGTTFYFTIPLEKTDSVSEIVSKKITTNHKLNWENKTILVAEDDEFNFLIIKEAVEETNIKILRAKTGNDVIGICNTEAKIDLILMDIQMPVMNGYVACSRVLEKFPDMQIIAQTAYTIETEKSKLLDAGFVDFIGKPINIAKMIQKLDKYLSKK